MRKYLKKVGKSLHDDKSVATEMLLVWIGAMLTLMVFLMVVGMIAGWQ